MICDKATRRINIGLAVLFVVAAVVAPMCGCMATLNQERINPDGSSYRATGRVVGSASIDKLQTTLSESVDTDGAYTLDIGQKSEIMKAEIAELITMLRELIKLLPAFL